MLLRFTMGVRRPFPGGAEIILFALKTTKTYYFSQKSLKNILSLAGLGRPGGQEPPLPPTME